MVRLKSPHCVPLVSTALPAPLYFFLFFFFLALQCVCTFVFHLEWAPHQVVTPPHPHNTHTHTHTHTMVSLPVCSLCKRQVSDRPSAGCEMLGTSVTECRLRRKSHQEGAGWEKAVSRVNQPALQVMRGNLACWQLLLWEYFSVFCSGSFLWKWDSQ